MYSHPCSQAGQTAVCIGPRKAETLGACKPLGAECPEEDLFSQRGPAPALPCQLSFLLPFPWDRSPV